MIKMNNKDDVSSHFLHGLFIFVCFYNIFGKKNHSSTSKVIINNHLK